MRQVFVNVRVLAALTISAALAAGAATGIAQSTSPRDALLITPAALATAMKDPNVVILHVGDRDKYAAKHIPGARFMDLIDISVSDYSTMPADMRAQMLAQMPPIPIEGPKNGLALEMPTPEQLRSQLAKFGISDNTRIIVYSADGYWSPSTRVMFTLDYAGLGAHTSLLYGNLSGWIAEGHEVTDVVPPAAAPGKLSTLKIRPLVVDAEYVFTHERKAGVTIIDARTGQFYDGIPPTGRAGDTGPPLRLGHVPGAKSLPFNTLNDTTGRLKSAAELSAMFNAIGVQKGDTIVAYCHIGQQATAVLFAARTLGYSVRLYDGSWDQWNGLTQYPTEVPSKKQ